ncbi:hypothetical protein EI94DRAFT_1705912 [Lactarius quietus]|nr:hypothetical protein EI94DRAFT_1705912 [Lactarius quietus]
MSKSIKELKSIPPNPPRWEPSSDPSSITIPGLDTTASVNDQIDQIDQLITLKLQTRIPGDKKDIDANFSKMQQVLSNRILPSFKRFAIGTEPVREAAKFWTSFFEHAAQVHIPTSDHLSSMQEPSGTTSSDAHDDAPSTTDESASSATTPGPSSTTFNLNRTPSESSFLPAHAAVSSTPAARTAQVQASNDNSTFFTSQTSISADPSWNALVESPLIRLDRELREFTRADPNPPQSQLPPPQTTHSQPPRARPTSHSPHAPPLNTRPTTTTTTHQQLRRRRRPNLTRRHVSPRNGPLPNISHALLRSALRDAGASSNGNTNASSSAVAPTPPSLSRFNLRGASASASLQGDPEYDDSLMRRVSLLPQGRPQQQQHVPASAAPLMTPPPAMATDAATPESDTSIFSSSSSGEDDSVHNTAHPSAAFLLASRQRGRHDDDDNDDEEDDSLDADPDATTASFEPVHPFARVIAGGAEDDSFDSLDGDAPEETVFGARPVKRGSLLPLGT